MQVFLDFRFRTREYSTVGAIEQYSLKTNSKIGLSFFRSEYALLTGPGSDKVIDLAPTLKLRPFSSP